MAAKKSSEMANVSTSLLAHPMDSPSANAPRSTDGSSTSDRSGLKFSTLLGIWKYDILLCCVSIAATVGLVVVLALHDGKAQKDWSGGVITLNTVIAVLATVIRASLIVPVAAAITQGKWLWLRTRKGARASEGRSLSDYEVYEWASRGVVGSTQLIWISGIRSIASLGALIVIFSVAIGPFTQQILGTTFRSVQSDTPGQSLILPRAERYDGFVESAITSTHYTYGRIIQPDMYAAIMSGIFSEKTEDLTAVCPSGNCTWPIQSSLGVCGECAAFSPEIKYNASINDSGWRMAYLQPEGSEIWATNTTDSFVVRVIGSNTGAHFIPSFGIEHYIKPTHFNDSHIPYLTIFQTITIPALEWDNATSSMKIPPSTGEECALWFCAQAYSTRVDSGVQSQTTVSTWSEYVKNYNPQFPSNGTIIDNPSTDLGEQEYGRPENWYMIPDASTFNLESGKETYFSIAEDSILAIGGDLNEIFVGSFNTTRMYGSISQPYTSNVMMAMHYFNTSTVVQNLAKAMTNRVRTSAPTTRLNTTPAANGTINGTTVPLSEAAESQDGELADRYAGAAFTTEPFFQVRWAWMALPLALVLLSPIFVVWTVVASWRTGTPILGSGLLVLLGCRVEDDIRSRFAGVERHDVAKPKAAGIKVNLERSEKDGGWEIRNVQGDARVVS
ncbi:hypothetical protein BS50DRAFT_569977 [Corynespora cassiicola Philippines]|uniref:Uncharacterized protein n=1 Tax=Corynespora cassiicola Philippines TaxID=1448308 RepID=A0A2T2P485_CORCC|nr:hypothetical protein BS50DRAFT_569977 [Corynespora cassiicola Philippines]